jgi:N-methylhydantoinase B
MPSSLDELGGESVLLEPKQSDLSQRPGEVICIRAAGGGGAGDPLTRSPSDVVADERDGRISPAAAAGWFGVVLSSSSAAGWDAAATTAERARLHAERAAAAGAPVRERRTDEEALLPPLALRPDGDGSALVCARCQTPLPRATASCRVRERALTQAGPLVTDAAQWLDDPFVLREFLCPGCGQLIESDVVRSSDAVVPDVLLKGA